MEGGGGQLEMTTEPMPAEVAGLSNGGTWECLTFRQGDRIPLRHCGVRPEADLVEFAGGGQLSEQDGEHIIFSAVIAEEVTSVELIDPATDNIVELTPVALSEGVFAVIGEIDCDGDPCEINVDVHAAERSVAYTFDLTEIFGTLIEREGT